MKFVPRSYQRTAIGTMLSNQVLGLFLDPGLGKTAISLYVMDILMINRKIKGTLVIAPLRVCYTTWVDEIEKWSNFNHIDATILHGKTKHTLWEKHDIYLINSEGLPWLMAELLKGLKSGKPKPFNSLWVDECTKFKNHESKRFKDMLCNMLPLFKRRYIMTGTLAPKSLLDLWSQIYILDEGKTLGNNYNNYRSEYFVKNDYNEYLWEIKDFCDDEIHMLTSKIILEMSAEKYLDMPPIIYNDIMVLLPKDKMKYYKSMERDMFIEIQGMETSAGAQAEATMKCHQIANGQVYEDIPDELKEEGMEDLLREFKKYRKTLPVHDAKIKALEDLLESLNGKPLMVVYHYKHDLRALLKAFKNKGLKIGHIGSGVSPKKTKEIVRQWNSSGLDLLLVQPDSMAHGLNMQESGLDIAWFSLTWNLELYIQLNARIWRSGVRDRVRIHHLIAKGTVDEAMMDRLGSRAKQQNDLREAIRNYRNSISSCQTI